MDLLFHPAFQSLVLPLCLAVAGMALLQRLAGPHRAALGAALGLVLALAVFPGFDWPALTRAQKLPWIVLAATLLAACQTGAGWARGARGWGMAWLAWALAHAWLAGAAPGWGRHALSLGTGALLLALLLPGERGVLRATGLSLASLALAAWAGVSGSLLLAQLALMLAVITGVAALGPVVWRQAALKVPSSALLPAALAWLAIATALLAPPVPDDPYLAPPQR